MKIIKLKSIVFSLIAVVMITVFLSSCEKDTIPVNDLKQTLAKKSTSLFKDIDLQSFDSGQITPPTFSTGYGNSVTFTQVPGKPEFFIGRSFEVEGYNYTKQSLILARYDSNTRTFTKIKDLLTPGTMVADGFIVEAAYDAHASSYEGAGSVAIASLDTENWILDLSSLSIVVNGTISNGKVYSASVPKILNYQNKIYLYYTSVEGCVRKERTEAFPAPIKTKLKL